ncbi:DNA internalization-related competence protein ComEC/Rec2 [Haloferula helveola]|uniref:DNA internalization-related competence protein ComEC/Rec2 n=1 Tax=Haloferula helveola TaxID=490095 RepID=A0ABM7RAD1_9BACT|nr:DNA internalization-related competence protein ComEC/Rec2 [Haloferula helveola]
MAVLAVAGVLVADGAWIVGLALLVSIAGVVGAAGCWRLLGAGAVVALVAGTLHLRDVSDRRERRDALGDGRYGELTLTLIEQPQAHGRFWSAVCEERGTEGKVRLRALGNPPGKGAVVEAKGVLKPPQPPRNPGEFDVRPWLDRKGVFAEMDGRVSVVREPDPGAIFGQTIREGFRNAVTRGLDPQSREAAVIRAVVLGEHPGDDVLIEPFRLSGTLHVFAVSGLHVGMVGLLGWLLMRSLGIPRQAALIPLVLMMFGYAWLTGMKPPAMRAAWMAAVVLGAFWFRRRPDLANALGLAALLVVLLDADRIFSVGVQLSFGVVAAIGLLHRPVSRLFSWIARPEPYLPRSLYGRWREGGLRIRQRSADLFTVSGSAWLGSAPLTAWHFGIVTPVSVVASVVLSLVVLPLLGIALMAAACSPLPKLSEWLNLANAQLAGIALSIAKAGQNVPGGHFSVPHGRPGDEFLIVYDLGDDGAACWHGGGSSLLIDGGGQWNFERVVLPSLREMALRPDSLVATHPDGGHVGGLVEAMDAFPVRRGLVPVQRALSSNYRDLLVAAEAREVPLVLGGKDAIYPLAEGARLEVLHQPDSWNWHQIADERVMPVRLNWRSWRILFVADAGWATERAMLESGADLRADVIVAGRHAHDLSLGGPFLRATGAKAVIASHAEFPPEERIPDSWRKSCESAGVAVFHQGESGAVVVTPMDGGIELRGFLDGRVLQLTR